MPTRLEQLLAFRDEDPDDSFIRFAIASEFVKLDRLDEARTEFANLVESDPAYVGTYYHLGKLQLRLGDTETACETYRAGIDQAARLSDHHALSELRSALLEVELGDL